MDFFGVRVPTSALPGTQSPAQYLENVRKDFPTYVDTTLSRFEFYPGLEGEQQRWESNNPLGTAFSIQLMAGGVDWLDDGTVVTSGYNSADWTFSTVYSPADGFHPVSGNRRFGYQDNGDGTVTLYTRGVDRLSNYGTQLGNWLSKFKPNYRPDGIAFINADDLWASFQQAIAADIGTQATILTPVTHRTDYDEVAAVLNREADPSTLLICK